jgi:1,2-diacylglycerol 3-beta-galactosyltransferase
MRITGLPVNPAFMDSLKGKAISREALGWDKEKITVLMVAGGDGMGPLYETARAIDALNLDLQLAVVAGRNKSLKAKLDSDSWNSSIHTYPFVTNMPQLMDAADIIVTKAGPATITEAAIAGLPMLVEAGRQLRAEGITFLDLTDVFRQTREQVYSDACCHLTTPGYALVAAAIGRRLEE